MCIHFVARITSEFAVPIFLLRDAPVDGKMRLHPIHRPEPISPIDIVILS